MKWCAKWSLRLLLSAELMLFLWQMLGAGELIAHGLSGFRTRSFIRPFFGILKQAGFSRELLYAIELTGLLAAAIVSLLLLWRVYHHYSAIACAAILNAVQSMWMVMEAAIDTEYHSIFLYVALCLLACAAAGCSMLFGNWEEEQFDPGAYPHVNPGSDLLVVYFSRDGHTRRIAYDMAERLRADVYEIRAAVQLHGLRGFLTCAWATLRCGEIPIEEPQIDWARYRRYVICTPVWGLSCAAPVRTFCRFARGRIHMVRYLALHIWKVNFSALFNEMDDLLAQRHYMARTISLHISSTVWRREAYYYGSGTTVGGIPFLSSVKRSGTNRSDPAASRRKRERGMKLLWDVGRTLLLLFFVTCVGVVLLDLGIRPVNMISLYIVGVLTVAISFGNIPCYVLYAACSILFYAFFFELPSFHLITFRFGHVLSFFLILFAAGIAHVLMGRMRQQNQQVETVAYRTSILLETTQLLQRERDEAGVLAATARQLMKLTGKSVLLYQLDADAVMRREAFVMGNMEQSDSLAPNEEMTKLVWERFVSDARENVAAPDDGHVFYAVRTEENLFGMLCIVVSERSMTVFERGMAGLITEECALVLERELYQKRQQEAAMQVRNEQIRTNFLRSISHDLRTPLTTISGSAHLLLSDDGTLSPERRRRLSADIYEDSLWLIDLVENLLSVTRMGEQGVELRLHPEVLEDVVQEVVQRMQDRCSTHRIRMLPVEECPMARIDARMIMQVVLNLLTNAVKYTPPGTEITVGVVQEGELVRVSVCDEGPGIPDAEKEKIFDLFYSYGAAVSDSRRGIGLGLALCRTIITAHGGELRLSDNMPHGAVFTFTLPAMEVNLIE